MKGLTVSGPEQTLQTSQLLLQVGSLIGSDKIPMLHSEWQKKALSAP